MNTDLGRIPPTGICVHCGKMVCSVERHSYPDDCDKETLKRVSEQNRVIHRRITDTYIEER